MKNFYSLFVVVALLSGISVFAQLPPRIAELQKKYESFFDLNRETIFLHLNKTAVVPNEDLWLSAYVYNNKMDLPNRQTVNLNVQVYDEQGGYIDSHIVFISEGKGSVFLDLDPEKYKPGHYFLKASTTYMQNFEEDQSYIQGFTVIGQDEELPLVTKDHDLQFLPEGGVLLTGAINSVGVKLINEKGEGERFQNAVLLDSGQNEITRFDSNKFGMARFFFTPEKGKKYRVILKTETGEEISKEIAEPEKQGFSLVSIDRGDHFLFTIRTNKATQNSIKDKDFLIVLHKDGYLKTLNFSFTESNLETNIIVSKDHCFGGVNTVTIFDPQLQPVLERKIFNSNKIKRGRIVSERRALQMDSLFIELSSSTPLLSEASLSISVLPSETKAYHPKHNILSAFILKPYVKGHIEEASYYFSDGNKNRKAYDLDLLLLTQGWSKFDWSEDKSGIPKERFGPEIGFTIEGSVIGRSKKENDLFIRSENTGYFEMVELQNNDRFSVKNAFIIDSTLLSFGVLNTRNDKVSKPSLTAKILPVKDTANHPTAFKSSEKYFIPEKKITIPENFLGGSIALDTVMIKSEKQEKEKDRYESQGFGEEIEITEAVANRFQFITDYLSTKGFEVTHGHGTVQVKNRMSSTLSSSNRNVYLYWNGAPIGTDHSILYGLHSSEVESIVINKMGYGMGGNGFNGAIRITTRKGGLSRDRTETVKTLIAGNGFSTNKEFYSPKYNSYSNKNFRDYGVIHWDSDFIIEPNGHNILKIFNVLQPNVNLYIEGMNADGMLFSEVLTVPLTSTK